MRRLKDSRGSGATQQVNTLSFFTSAANDKLVKAILVTTVWIHRLLAGADSCVIVLRGQNGGAIDASNVSITVLLHTDAIQIGKHHSRLSSNSGVPGICNTITRNTVYSIFWAALQ
jgi:hypothetical protein